jgi:hypothetical protein
MIFRLLIIYTSSAEESRLLIMILMTVSIMMYVYLNQKIKFQIKSYVTNVELKFNLNQYDVPDN